MPKINIKKEYEQFAIIGENMERCESLPNNRHARVVDGHKKNGHQ